MCFIEKCAPLILFVYNRPNHTNSNLYRLNDIECVENTELFIFSDQAKDEGSVDKVNQVRNILEKFKEKDSRFLNVNIIKAERNKGLAQSIIEGVTEIIEKYGNVIVLEDDMVVSNDFLIYMNSALEFYQSTPKIWAISGYTFPMNALKNYGHDVYLARRGCSWGWATWSDRWKTVDWEVKDYSTIKYNFRNRLEFGRWGRDMPFMLDENMYGLNHSWAIRWCYASYKQDKYTVYPVESRIISNGTDGSGTNYKKTIHKYDTTLISANKLCHFEMIDIDKRIEREFRKKHKKKLGVIRDHFKWLMIKRGLIKPKK